MNVMLKFYLWRKQVQKMCKVRLEKEAIEQLALVNIKPEDKDLTSIIKKYDMFLPDIYYAGDVTLEDVLYHAIVIVSVSRTIIVLVSKKNKYFLYGDAYGEIDYTVVRVSIVDNDILVEGIKRKDKLELSLEEDSHNFRPKVAVKWK